LYKYKEGFPKARKRSPPDAGGKGLLSRQIPGKGPTNEKGIDPVSPRKKKRVGKEDFARRREQWKARYAIGPGGALSVAEEGRTLGSGRRAQQHNV